MMRLAEKLAERFHAAPAFLQSLNRRSRLEAGQDITVPAVSPFDANVKPSAASAASDVTVQVTREESAVRVTRADGTLVFFCAGLERQQPRPVAGWRLEGRVRELAADLSLRSEPVLASLVQPGTPVLFR